MEEATNNEEKSEEVNKDKGERDLFRLMVVNSYGSQDIKKLTDDPKKTLLLSGVWARGCVGVWACVGTWVCGRGCVPCDELLLLTYCNGG